MPLGFPIHPHHHHHHHGGGGWGWGYPQVVYAEPQVIEVQRPAASCDCPRLWAPVRAEDGRVYANACAAYCRGLQRVSRVPDSTPLGGYVDDYPRAAGAFAGFALLGVMYALYPKSGKASGYLSGASRRRRKRRR